MTARKDKRSHVRHVPFADNCYIADFETTTDPDDCRVWAWAIVNVHDTNDILYGSNINSFMRTVMQSKNYNNIMFHNLKFDGTFIMSWLLSNGYTWKCDENKTKGWFDGIISDKNVIYNIRVCRKRGHGSGHNLEFFDSLKKIPLPVKRIAPSFGLEEGKGEIDYDKPRPVGYMMDDVEQDYIRRDVVIVAQAMKRLLDEGMDKMTIGADSLAHLKTIKSVAGSKFLSYMPHISLDIDDIIRDAYIGGYTYADPRFTEKVQGAGRVYDVNSMYPSIMRDAPFPTLLGCGEVPVTDYEDRPSASEYPLCVFMVCFTAKLKPGYVPVIPVRNSSYNGMSGYISDTDDLEDKLLTRVVTNVDWELYNRHYDIDVAYYGGCVSFKSVTGLFNEYLDGWYDTKKTATDPGTRYIAKLHLNTVYGKFATNPRRLNNRPYLDAEGVLRYEYDSGSEGEPIWTAGGVFITAWARKKLTDAIQANYDRFMYADTDSIHLLGDYDAAGIEIDPTKLGAWDHESTFTHAKYLGAKTYLEMIKDKDGREFYSAHVAGLDKAAAKSLTFDNFNIGQVVDGGLKSRNVPGGVVLKAQPFKIRER